MSDNSAGAPPPVEDFSQLVAYIADGEKPRDRWRIGTEHEKFAYRHGDLGRLDYEGPQGIRAMLEGLQRFGWQPVYEAGNVIALAMDGATITLEPGGQFELSGAPLDNLHQTCAEVHTHLAQVKVVAEEMDVGFMGLGFDPKWRRDEIPIMPKGRYKLMLAYMPTRGNLGPDMMLRSCTVQVNLDFGSEADMVQKFRVGLALQPLTTALFANSPFTEGKPNDFLSFRSQIWTDTDPDRTGMLPFVFDGDMGYEAYAEYALDVPMYFVYRDGEYLDATGQSFRDFMAGKLPALPGEKPNMKDWEDHLTTLFPEVRMKKFLEMRGADGGPWASLCAMPALWVGLLYNQGAQEAAWDLVKNFTVEEMARIRAEVPRLGLATPLDQGGTLLDIAKPALEIAMDGLRGRARPGAVTADETEYLGSLHETVAAGRTPAEVLLERYNDAWGKSVDPIYTELAY
ncbi:MAG: glutamate--cysteine ligase [Rhodospirillaceae bacterium]|jgi:glutamate--cysteine ligase|nr:glutamate--cysteine ligase [Rhodospirillaceae bacterium]MBT5897092.1 glutamate--cysteine ligase [Rhodospirillaceae bacterium]MBT6427582.1 glutamate--cysteine ligase [Rhodospirillaceae bacterium]MBT7758057.1 glutamate--cysteine ligase [Rhodospirillaceae bacterium]